MAVLKLTGPQGEGLKEVMLHNATSIGYAALHVAEELGLDPAGDRYMLLRYPDMERIPDGDIVADYDGVQVCLASPVH